MKIIVEVLGMPDRLAELCHRGTDRCPVGLSSAIDCPFREKTCDEIVPDDWAKLDVSDEDVCHVVHCSGAHRYCC